MFRVTLDPKRPDAMRLYARRFREQASRNTDTYHDDGSLHHVDNAAGTLTLKIYTYTDDGLLDSATYRGGMRTLSNTWDADKNRVKLDPIGPEYEFVYDTTAGIPAVIAEVQPDDSVVYYIRGPGGSLIARIDGEDTHYYHFDALGSTRLLTDDDGNVTDRYAYDAYGALIAHDVVTSDSIDQPYQYVGQLGYYTHWQEPEFGLLQLGVRYYDPEAARFTTRDPAKEGISAATYVSGNPMSATDATGLAVDWKWTEKARKCGWKAANKCRDKIGKPKAWKRCYWREVASCMGKAWAIADCERNICWLFPRAEYCMEGNACDRWKEEPKQDRCDDCCDIKRACCMLVHVWPILWNPPAATLATKRCDTGHTACTTLCHCK